MVREFRMGFQALMRPVRLARFFLRSVAFEGIVVKPGRQHHPPGKRSPSWRKIKVRPRQELVTGVRTRAKGSLAGQFGSLLLGVYEGGSLLFASKVARGSLARNVPVWAPCSLGWPSTSRPRSAAAER